MRENSVRLADVPVPKIWLRFLRSPAFPLWGIYVLVLRRRNERIAAKGAEKLTATAAEVVAEAKTGAETLRKLTYAIAFLTLVNTGFVIYSALR